MNNSALNLTDCNIKANIQAVPFVLTQYLVATLSNNTNIFWSLNQNYVGVIVGMAQNTMCNLSLSNVSTSV